MLNVTITSALALIAAADQFISASACDERVGLSSAKQVISTNAPNQGEPVAQIRTVR